MKTPPFEFVLEELDSLSPRTNPMFGAHAIYVGDKIIFILRERESSPGDNGIWLATTAEHHESLKKDFPSMRSIEVFGQDGPTGWQNLPADASDFEEAALKACGFVLEGDERIGKVPKSKLKSKREPARKPALKAAPKSKRTTKLKPKTKAKRKPK